MCSKVRSFVLILSLLCVQVAVVAQWEPLGGPYGASINNFYSSDDVYFLSTSHGFYTFSENSDSWNKLKIPDIDDYYLSAIVKKGNTIILLMIETFGEQFKLFRSKNGGENWHEILFSQSPSIGGLVSNSYGIYLLGSESLYVSADDGDSWQLSHLNQTLEPGSRIYSYENSIFITNSELLYMSSPGSDDWTIREITGNGLGYKLYVFDSLFFAVGIPSNILFISENAGLNWVLYQPTNWDNSNFVRIGNNIFGFRNDLIYRSTNHGKTFTRINLDTLPYVIQLASIHDSLLISTSKGQIIIDTLGNHSKPFEKGLDASWIWSVELYENDFWMSIRDKGIVKMNSSSPELTQLKYPDPQIWDILTTSNAFYATNASNYILESVDGGNTWLKRYQPFNGYELHFLFQDSLNIYVTAAGTEGQVMFRKVKTQTVWEKFVIPEVDAFKSPKSMYQVNDYVFAIYDNKIARQFKYGNWEVIVEENNIYTSIDLFYTGDELIGYIKDKDIYSLVISMDFGVTWKEINTDTLFPGYNVLGFVHALFLKKDIIAYCGSQFEKMYISHDLGNNWIPFNEGRYNGWIDEFLHDDTYIYASTYGQSIYKRKISDLSSSSSEISHTKTQSLEIFPNPSNGIVTVKIPYSVTDEGSILIHDVLGNVISRLDYNNQEFQVINLSNQPSGLYFASISTGNKIFIQKFSLSW